jgi:hypothetical protein
MTLPCTAPTLSKLRRWSYARKGMPPVTKGQSGQVHDDRRLSVPQLSATATADRFESYWDSDRFKEETSHCRWLGDGLFFQAPGDGDASSGAVSYTGYCAPCSGTTPKPQIRPQQTNPGWQLRWFFPTSYASRVTLSDMQRQRHRWSRLRSSERHQTSQCFRLSSENIGSSSGSNACRSRRHNNHNTQIVSPLICVVSQRIKEPLETGSHRPSTARCNISRICPTVFWLS